MHWHSNLFKSGVTCLCAEKASFRLPCLFGTRLSGRPVPGADTQFTGYTSACSIEINLNYMDLYLATGMCIVTNTKWWKRPQYMLLNRKLLLFLLWKVKNLWRRRTRLRKNRRVVPRLEIQLLEDISSYASLCLIGSFTVFSWLFKDVAHFSALCLGTCSIGVVCWDATLKPSRFSLGRECPHFTTRCFGPDMLKLCFSSFNKRK